MIRERHASGLKKKKNKKTKVEILKKCYGFESGMTFVHAWVFNLDGQKKQMIHERENEMSAIKKKKMERMMGLINQLWVLENGNMK